MVKKSLKKNTIYSVLKTFSSVVFPLITFPYISRVLMAQNVGKIHFGLSIISYFQLIATLGITTYAIRECSVVRENKTKLSQLASQIFSINVCTTIISYVLLALIVLINERLKDYKLLLFIQSLTIACTTIGADWLNSAMEDFRFITIRTVSFQILALILMLLFVHAPEDYIKYAIIGLFSSSGACLLNIIYRKKYCTLNFTTHIELKKHFSPIVFLFVMVLAQDIFNNADTTMLGLMIGDREVGIYSAAHKMAKMINQFVASVLWVILPRMSYYFAKGNYDEINKLLKKILGFYLLLGLPCAVGTIMLSNDIIYIIAGEDFKEAASVLQILMIGFIIKLFGENFLGNAVLLPSKKEKYFMFVCCVSAIINVIINYLYIPSFGAKAAAMTTSICSLLILLLLLINNDKRIRILKMIDITLAPLIGSVAIIIVCILFRTFESVLLRITLSFFFSTIVYAIIQLLFKNSLVIDLLQPIIKMCTAYYKK